MGLLSLLTERGITGCRLRNNGFIVWHHFAKWMHFHVKQKEAQVLSLGELHTSYWCTDVYAQLYSWGMTQSSSCCV